MNSVPSDHAVTAVTLTFQPTAGRTFAGQLHSTTMPEVDFDALGQWLITSSDQLVAATERETVHARLAADHERLICDHQLLREDYAARIVGMLKAIAIVSQAGARAGRVADDSVAAILDALPAMSAAELIKCYRRTATIFRDHFPGSYSLPTGVDRPAPTGSDTPILKGPHDYSRP